MQTWPKNNCILVFSQKPKHFICCNFDYVKISLIIFYLLVWSLAVYVFCGMLSSRARLCAYSCQLVMVCFYTFMDWDLGANLDHIPCFHHMLVADHSPNLVNIPSNLGLVLETSMALLIPKHQYHRLESLIVWLFEH